MEENNASTLQTLTEIKQLMERSSRFISLSGLSGVFAGMYALTGAAAAYWYLHLDGFANYAGSKIMDYSRRDELGFILLDAFLVLVLAISTGIFLTTRKARKDGNSIFDKTAKKLIVNLCIPLITGGLFCVALLYHNALFYVAPAMLVFYGLSLLHASNYTRSDIRILAYAEIVLGLLSIFIIGYGFLFWTIGFGVLHIVYGTYMYFKYEM
jgi:hypothetical protein